MGISLTNLHALLITKELAGLINHLSSKEEPKQGASRTDKGNILLQGKLPDWKIATPREVSRIYSNWVKVKDCMGRLQPLTQFRTKRLTSPHTHTSLDPAQ